MTNNDNNVEEKKDEIKIENKDNINRNKENAALMVFIGNISNLNDYLSNQSKIKKIFSGEIICQEKHLQKW